MAKKPGCRQIAWIKAWLNKKSRVWIKLVVVQRLHWINKKKRLNWIKKKIKLNQKLPSDYIELNKKIKLNQKLPTDYIELIKKDQTE